jgi:hypothetical protein
MTKQMEVGAFTLPGASTTLDRMGYERDATGRSPSVGTAA